MRLFDDIETDNVVDISRWIIEVMTEHPTMNMGTIETMIRATGNDNVWLVAWPPQYIPSEFEPCGMGGTPASYGLWVCVNGREDMLNQLVEFNMTIEQNRAYLKVTGIGIKPKGQGLGFTKHAGVIFDTAKPN